MSVACYPFLPYSPTNLNDKADTDSLRLMRPSEMLRRARAVMEVLIDLEDLIRIDVVAVFSSVFEQHTQPSSDTSKVRGWCRLQFNLPLLSKYFMVSELRAWDCICLCVCNPIL